MRYLPLLWAGPFRRRARTILTILSVVISFLLLGLLDAVTVAFESGADSGDAEGVAPTAAHSSIAPPAPVGAAPARRRRDPAPPPGALFDLRAAAAVVPPAHRAGAWRDGRGACG